MYCRLAVHAHATQLHANTSLGVCSSCPCAAANARTALLPLGAQEEGTLEDKLHEMYRWGKQYGWEPVVHVDGVPQPPTMTPAAAAAAAVAAAAVSPAGAAAMLPASLV